ncbi:MAG: hypothetical protein ACP5JJ_08850, partial [Anaerolineae bacterium]
MQKRQVLIGAVVTVLLLVTGSAYAQGTAPERETETQTVLGTAFTYQGQLRDEGGLVDDTCDLTFKLYDAAGSGAPPTGGTLLGTVEKPDHDIVEGLFTVQLDFGSGVFIGDARWLQIAVDCGDGAVTLSPRQALTAAPYAQHAVNVGSHDHWGEHWTGTGTGLTLSGSGGGSIGVHAIASEYGVCGWATGDSGDTRGVYAKSASDSGSGVYAWATAHSGYTRGVYGRSDSDSGRGVYGYASATSGTTYGVHGRSASDSGSGVYGYASADSGTTYGVYGRSDSSSGRGVYGYASANSGYTRGVYGQSDSHSGYGVYGWATDNSGYTYGVCGRSDSDSGRALYGYASATSGTTYGVYARSVSPSGRAVYGYNSAGYAGYFVGDVDVNGHLNKTSGSFKIDHPLDPENQYLYHSFVESPDMKNIYDGVVRLDAQGQAVVQLPDWFEALNQDFRYQLTPIGASMPDLYIAEEVGDNRFKIAGGVPGKKVSWQLTGIRHDPYAEANRIAVEEEKPADEKGTYLYPEGYGQSEEVGLDYQPNAGLSEQAPDTSAEALAIGSGE